MFPRLVLYLLRRWAVYYGLLILFVAGLTFGLLYTQHLPDMRPLPGDVGQSLALFIAFPLGPLMAMGAFVRREFHILPLSDRDFWLARWVIGTVGTATWLTLARTIGVSVALANGIPVVDNAASPLVFWPLAFVYSGAFFGLVAQGARSPALVALCERMASPKAVGKKMLAGALLGGAGTLLISPGVLQRVLWPASWAEFNGIAVVIAGAALAFTIVGYRHQPARGPAQSPFRVSDLARPRGTARPMTMHGLFSGASLLVWQGILRGLATSGFMLVMLIVLQPHRPPFADRILEIARRFDEGILFKYAGGVVPIIDNMWLPLIVVGAFTPLTWSLRHLRTLPMSTATLNALLFIDALPHIVCLLSGFSLLHLLIAGSLPRFDVASCVLSAGIATLAHSWQLTFTGAFRIFFSWVLVVVLVLLVGAAMRLPLPAPLGMLTLPATIGAGMMLGAVAWNHWLLTRRTSPYLAPAWPGDPS